MKTRKMRRVTARYRWDRLKVSFWFAPVVMAVIAVLLAWALSWVDSLIPNESLENSRLVLSGGPTEIRTMLLGMAGTILATAGVVFTLLTLPLSTVAAQYGSRLLRVFLGDRTTQLVLGMFVATFIYCVAAALSIPPVEVNPDGPQVTATIGLLLMMATFGSLILLVQHISTMLQAPNIAAAAGAELMDVVRAEIPEEVRSGGQTGQEAAETLAETDGFAVRVRRAGYLQYIDPQSLLTLARENDLVIRLLSKPGHFVWDGAAVALVWPASPRQEQAGLRPGQVQAGLHRIDEQLETQFLMAFRLGNMRTPTQDVAYAVNQLVEMAVRAMSPAINDPFTAMTCLDYLGEGLALFIQQGEKGCYYNDRDGRLRLILEPVTFGELLDGAFNMLRHCSSGNASVLLHMLEVIQAIGREADSPRAREELLRHVGLIQAEGQAGDLIAEDRERIQLSIDALVVSLKASS